MKQSTYYYLLRRGVIGGGGSKESLILDTYSGATAAYSIRKLSSTYSGYCLKVRNKTTQTTTDIGFDSNGLIDTTALATAANESGATKQLAVIEWYDQSGNANNATQTTASSQPVIYKGTGLQEMNGKPVVVETNTNSHMAILGITSLTNNAWIFAATKVNDNDLFMGDNGSQPFFGFGRSGNTNDSMNPSDAVTYYKNGGSALTSTTQDDIFNTYNSQSLATFKTTNFVLTNHLELGWSATYSMWDLQELIIYDSDQSSNRSGIESNINDYYSIY